MGYNGVLGWTLYEKSGINSERLKIFLEENITSKYKNKCIINSLNFLRICLK